MNDSSGSFTHAKTRAEEAGPDSCCHWGPWAAAGAGEGALLGGGPRAALTG